MGNQDFFPNLFQTTGQKSQKAEASLVAYLWFHNGDIFCLSWCYSLQLFHGFAWWSTSQLFHKFGNALSGNYYQTELPMGRPHRLSESVYPPWQMIMADKLSHANSNEHSMGDPDEVAPKTCFTLHLLTYHHHCCLFNSTHFNRQLSNTAAGSFVAIHVERYWSGRR